MIHLEIIQTPDPNVQATFQFYQNQLYIGRSSGDLLIQDIELHSSHLMIEVINNELLIHPQKNVTSFLINGKRATAIRKMKSQDILTIGKTSLKLLDFSDTHLVTKKEMLNKKLQQLINQQAPRLVAVEALTQMMKQNV